jgi:hypothetical protein
MTSNDDDLDWLFGCADAAMGMRSTFGAMIDALKVGYQDTRAGDDGLVSAAHEQLHHEATAIGCGRGAVQLSRSAATRRYGRVVKVFATLAPLHKRVLEAWFYPRQWPPQVTAYFGRAAGVVALCESAAAFLYFSFCFGHSFPAFRVFEFETIIIHSIFGALSVANEDLLVEVIDQQIGEHVFIGVFEGGDEFAFVVLFCAQTYGNAPPKHYCLF